MSNSHKTIVICSSANFYEHVGQLADQLEAMGYQAVMPLNAVKMKASGDYDVAKTKTWYDNPADFHKKQSYMDAHFKEIADGDAVLLVNDTKHGVEGYIGPNGLMEMAVGYYLKKPIFILHDVAKEVGCYEEVMGMGTIQLHGDIENLKF